jgi:hypothetical protein
MDKKTIKLKNSPKILGLDISTKVIAKLIKKKVSIKLKNPIITIIL